MIPRTKVANYTVMFLFRLSNYKYHAVNDLCLCVRNTMKDFKLNNHVFSGVYKFDSDLLLPTSN